MQSSRPRWAHAVASGFGSGLAPFSPGTFGSLAATAVWLALAECGGATRAIAAAACLIFCLAGTYAVKLCLIAESDPDPSWIVIDEWAGIFLGFVIYPDITLKGTALLFALFRAFDIIKRGPVGMAERLPGAYGIMADDLVAGILAGIVAALL